MPTALVIGASRGHGLALTRTLHDDGYKVYSTIRASSATDSLPAGTFCIPDIDLEKADSGEKIVKALEDAKLDLVVFNAGLYKAEDINSVNFEDEVSMYKTVAVAPVVIAHHLLISNSFASNAKFILITTEGGSITLRTREEGGGNFGHHGSKAAANMIGKLLAFDLLKYGITTVMIHPGFMKTDMTKAVGFDKFYESGGAVEAREAARSTADFIKKVTPDQNATFWAPRGPRDIGEAERVLGKNLPTPLQLPW